MTTGLISSAYGPWALVAGSAEGIGLEFCRLIAASGISIVMVDRDRHKLDRAIAGITPPEGTRLIPLVADLADESILEILLGATSDIEIGLVVCNAAKSHLGPFVEAAPSAYREIVATNCTAPLLLSRHFGKLMAERGRGGIILMSSLSAFQGSPFIAAYGATKAFNLVLGEGLWSELSPQGVDVTVCAPGATRTPAYLASKPEWLTPSVPEMEPHEVAREALAALGKKPLIIPGRVNRLAYGFMSRLIPRTWALAIMKSTTEKMFARTKQGEDTHAQP